MYNAFLAWMRTVGDLVTEDAPSRGATMFESSLFESTPVLQTRNRWPALLSFALQASVATALILIPLLHPDVLPLAMLPKVSVVAPRYRPTPPPVPVLPVPVQTLNTPAAAATQMLAPQLPRRGFESSAATVDEPALAAGLSMGEPTATPLSEMPGPSATGPRVSLAAAAAPGTQPGGVVKVSRGVIAGLLMTPIEPEYPPMAKITRTEGTVVVQAVISATGRIESAHVISGPEMLQAAALQAVRNARYRPFRLNDRPTEVETTISITFQLRS